MRASTLKTNMPGIGSNVVANPKAQTPYEKWRPPSRGDRRVFLATLRYRRIARLRCKSGKSGTLNIDLWQVVGQGFRYVAAGDRLVDGGQKNGICPGESCLEAPVRNSSWKFGEPIQGETGIGHAPADSRGIDGVDLLFDMVLHRHQEQR